MEEDRREEKKRKFKDVVAINARLYEEYHKREVKTASETQLFLEHSLCFDEYCPKDWINFTKEKKMEEDRREEKKRKFIDVVAINARLYEEYHKREVKTASDAQLFLEHSLCFDEYCPKDWINL
ncbi:hypothetical protein CEXT_331261 [Caerostris extrusa]|uniref:Uncharacterized protein n=1 Tax=Caerostris extrusa TaxID=172846 RepID=A0AAV4U5G0_CAEEX|nr:hypothetical protein CEXT_331261 [Caerostris extrusa]